MSVERRYGDDEVREIFERAGSTRGDAGHHVDPSAEGMTLAELQVIAREVGLTPSRIAEAAANLDYPSAAERRARFGMPVSITRTVPLARLPTDYEWELLLAELRSNFEALGSDRSIGNTREWTDGTLFAVVEPTETGCRIRLGSSRPLAVLAMSAGFAWIVAAAITLLTLIATGDLAGVNGLIAPAMAAVGVATILYTGSRLENWARRRAAQFGRITDIARSIIAADPRITG